MRRWIDGGGSTQGIIHTVVAFHILILFMLLYRSLYPLAEWVAVRYLRKPYLELQEQMNTMEDRLENQ